MQKTLNYLLKTFIIGCFFITYLILFTHFLKDPFFIQNVVSVFSIFGAILVLLFDIKRRENFVFLFSKADIALLFFIIIVLFSFCLNLFTTQTPLALLNDFVRRGHAVITALLCGYTLARLLGNTKDFFNFDIQKEDNYKNGFLFLLWGLLWVPFRHFSMNTDVFDIYGILMWTGAVYIGFRFLRKFNIKSILDILISAVVLACAYGICQNFNYDFIWTFNFSQQFGSRGISTFGNPNFLSSFILLVLPLSLFYYFYAKERGAKIYYFVVNLICFVYFVIAQARSSWIGLFCAVVLLLLSKPFRTLIFKNKIKLAVLTGSLIMLVLIWPSHKAINDVDKMQDIKISSQSLFSNPKNLTLAADKEALTLSYHQRLMGWVCGVENLKNNPFFGLGWGSWQLAVAPCQGKLLKKYPNLERVRMQSNSAHNVFVETFSQSGLLGFISYLALLFLSFFAFGKYYIKQKDLGKKLFFLAVFCAVIGFLADNMLNMTFQLQVLAFAFYFLVGILASLDTKEKPVKKTLLPLFLVLFIALFIFFGTKQVESFLASHYSLTGYTQMQRNNLQESKKLFTKSLALFKEHPETHFAYYVLLEKLKAYPDMEIVLFDALEYFPYYYEFYDIMGGFKAKFGQEQEAFEYAKKSLNLYPYFGETFKLIINLFTNSKELRTLENAQYLESLKPPVAYQNAFNIMLAQIYFENSFYDKARAILTSELSKNKFDKNVQEELAKVNNKLGIKKDPVLKDAKALSDLRGEIISSQTIKPDLLNKIKSAAKTDDREALMLLAQAYFKMREYQKSYLILADLYKTNSSFLPLNFAFASLEEARNNKEEAKKYLQNILVIDPENQLALRRLDSLK